MKLKCCVRCYAVDDEVGENEEEGWMNMVQTFISAKVKYYNNEEYVSFCFLKSLTNFNKNKVGEEKYGNPKKSI